MNSYGIRIVVHDGELKQVLHELSAAQAKIYECYNKLEQLGVLVIGNEVPTSGNK